MPKIFISHRHKEKSIADIINEKLQLAFDPRDIYLSSEPTQNKTAVGDELQRSIAEAARDSKLFILIYTTSEGNWDWVMHEAGLALDPSNLSDEDETGTRIVVFKCCNEIPRIFTARLMVEINEDSILQFVTNIFTQDNFVPGENAPRSDLKNSQNLRKWAHQLYEELSEAVSSLRTPTIQCRWDYFTVELDNQTVEQVRNDDLEEAQKLDLICSESIIIGRYALGLNHFGYDFRGDSDRNFSEDRSLRDKNYRLKNLFDRWKTKQNYESLKLPNWAKGILEEMKRTIDFEYAEPPKFLMRSVSHFKEDWFYPVVNTVRTLSNGNMEFDIYIFRLPSDLPWLDSTNISES